MKTEVVLHKICLSVGEIFEGNLVSKFYCLLSHMNSDAAKWVTEERINPLRANFLRENINISLNFMSFLHTNKIQVTEIPPRVKRRPAYST